MVFSANGTWSPSTNQNMNTTSQPAPNMSQAPQQMQAQTAMMRPQMQPQQAQAAQSIQPGYLNYQPQQGAVLPDGPPDPGRPQNQIYNSQPQYQPMMHPQFQPMPPQMPQQSVMQSVNNANPQSVQNFLQALNKSPQASQGNAWQNPMGTQGQQAQAGFQGFQQNGSAQPQTQWQGYSQQPQAQLGSYANQAQQGGPVYQQPLNGSMGGSMNGNGGQVYNGGVANQPGYQPPASNTMSNSYNQNMSAASDVNSKQNIQGGDQELQGFLNSLGVHSYEYKDSKYGEGRRISPMAQEIEKTPIGQAAISINAEGYKIVDYGKLMGTQLAALALLNHKYNDLESKLKEAMIVALKEKGK